MKKSFSFLFLLIFLSASGRAAVPTPVDLGYDLSYLHVHALADAAPLLPPALAAKHAFVLDLRYATTDEASTAALRSALAQHPADVPLFILLSPATPANLVDAVNQAPHAFITLGLISAKSAARVQVKTDVESDRRAYDALENGTPVETLISGKVEKERFDEATLMEEFKNGNPDAEPPAPPDPTDAKPDGADAKPAPLVDRVLQRAVHLHRALLALRK